MTGYNSPHFRYSCRARGCYIEQLPDWSWFIDAFPRSIRPTDIDGMVEINSQFLFLEEKSAGVSLDRGQRIALQRLSSLPGVTVFVFRPAGVGVELLTFPNPSGWDLMSRPGFRARISEWAARADRPAAA